MSSPPRSSQPVSSDMSHFETNSHAGMAIDAPQSNYGPCPVSSGESAKPWYGRPMNRLGMPSCALLCGRHHPVSSSGAGAVPGRGFRPFRLASCGDDHHRAGRVLRDLAAHRAYEELGEHAAAAGPHDEHVGVMRGVDEFFGGIARDHALNDLGRRLAEILRYLVHHLLKPHSRGLGIKAPIGKVGHIPVDLGGWPDWGRVNRHDGQRDMMVRSLTHCPAESTAGMVRTVYPDEDSAHFCSSGPRLVPIRTNYRVVPRS